MNYNLLHEEPFIAIKQVSYRLQRRKENSSLQQNSNFIAMVVWMKMALHVCHWWDSIPKFQAMEMMCSWSVELLLCWSLQLFKFNFLSILKILTMALKWLIHSRKHQQQAKFTNSKEKNTNSSETTGNWSIVFKGQ